MTSRHPILSTVPAMALAAALALALAGCGKPLPTLAGKKAEWAAFGYQRLGGPTPKQFDPIFTIQGAASGPAPCGRLVLNAQDQENYYYVQFTEQAIEIGRVENGVEVHIGSRSNTGIGRGTPHKIVVERRSASLAVVMDQTVAATAYDDTFTGGDVFLGGRSGSVTYEKPRIQNVETPCFTDDFMKAEEDKIGDWQILSGKWDVNRLENPLLSSNAFCLVKAPGDTDGKTVVAPFKNWFWSDYSCRVSIRPLGKEPVGILFYYRDEDNYFLFRWGARESKSPRMELIKRHGGEDQVLAAKDGGFTKDHWYLVRVEVIGTHARITVDDHPVFEIEDTNLCFGTIGLYSAAGQGAQFDDIEVKSVPDFRDDFRVYAAGRWAELGGDWKIVGESGGGNSFAVDTGSGSAKALSGEPGWRNYTYSARVGPWTEGTAGICFYYQDEQNYYAVTWRKGRSPERALIKVVDGKETVLRRDTPPEGGSGRYRLRVTLDDGHIAVSTDGKRLFEDWDADLDCGRIGLYASKTPSALFGDVELQRAREKSAVPTMHEAFSRETTMSDWAGVKSDWEDARDDTVGEKLLKTRWYRADFPRDVDLEFRRVPKLEGDAELRLLLAGDGEEHLSGYSLVLTPGSKDNLAVRKGEQVVAKASLDTSREINGLRFRRVGSYVAALLGHRLLTTYRDESPPTGQRIGYGVRDVAVKPTNIDVFCSDVHNYTFRESIYDWRVASGTWEVSNRWQCDPRWSFFSGYGNKLVAIWNKREMKGDITVEFFAGPKMDQDRGRKYEYFSDMNVTICADGKDLTSGYSFIFGGYQNSRTRIMKGHEVLAEKFKRIPIEMNIHRRWFHIRAERKGTHLAFYVDNELLLECNDPKPLDGGHVALWTYNNGIMISRVRISTTDNDRKESPFDKYPDTCECVYDKKRT